MKQKPSQAKVNHKTTKRTMKIYQWIFKSTVSAHHHHESPICQRIRVAKAAIKAIANQKRDVPVHLSKKTYHRKKRLQTTGASQANNKPNVTTTEQNQKPNADARFASNQQSHATTP